VVLLLACGEPVRAQYSRLHYQTPYPTFAGDGTAQLVRSWYQRFLRREPDLEGLATHVNALRSGQPPEEVLATIAGSDEYYQFAGQDPVRFARQLYQDLSGQDPTQAQLLFWAQRLRVMSPSDIAYQMILRCSGAAQPAQRSVVIPYGSLPGRR
jgi:hypothetical protein